MPCCSLTGRRGDLDHQTYHNHSCWVHKGRVRGASWRFAICVSVYTAAQICLSPDCLLMQASGVTEGLIRVAVGIESTGQPWTSLTGTIAGRYSHSDIAMCPAADVIEDFQLALASLAQMGNTLQDGKATEFGVRTSILTKSGLSLVKSLADEMATSMAMPTNPVPTAV